jgi:hypothetical protein
MKRAFLVLAIMSLGVAPVFGQSGGISKSLPPGWIDGSKDPNLIPDRVAYRMVFLSLLLPNSPDQTAFARQQARLNRIGLSDTDKAVLMEALVTFGSDYSAWRRNQVKGQIWPIVNQTQSQLQSQLSADGNAKFAAYVALAKTHMVLGPN